MEKPVSNGGGNHRGKLKRRRRIRHPASIPTKSIKPNTASEPPAPPQSWDSLSMREERYTFLTALHAAEPCGTDIPDDHVPRPPTVLWKTDQTIALDRLDCEPDRALAIPIAKAPIALRAPGAPIMVSDGPWYAKPFLKQLIARGRSGFGCIHARPPLQEPIRGDSRRVALRDNLSSTQVRALANQDTGSRNFIIRINTIIRERMLHTDPRMGDYTVGLFMEEIDRQCGERLVHISCIESGPAEDRRLCLKLAYAVGIGGRFYVGVYFDNLRSPTVQDRASFEPLLWTDIPFSLTETPPAICRYSCPCILSHGAT